MKHLKRRKIFKDSLQDTLKKIIADIPEAKAAQLTTDTGQPLASILPSDADDMRFAAMTAALCSLSERAINEFNLGNFDQLYVKSTEGYILILHAGEDQVLTVSTKKDIRLAPILMKRYDYFDDDDKLISNTAHT